MSILVVGSVAFDTLKTPYGERQKILGGAATYFSLSASYFTDVRVVAVVGEDFTPENEAVMNKRGVDTRGIQHAKGKTFHWTGEYGENVNEAKTLNTELNVFETFQAVDSRRISQLGFPLSRQHRSRAADSRARQHAESSARGRRYDELLDQWPSREP